MMIKPKRGYRVCLKCGKICASKQLVEVNYNNKNMKACPYCKTPENVDVGGNKIGLIKAQDLFRIVEMKSKEFVMSEEIEEKYKKMYDNCLIPEDIRI